MSFDRLDRDGVLFEYVQQKEAGACPDSRLRTIAGCRCGFRPGRKLSFCGLRRTDLTDFVRQYSLSAARAVIQEAEHLELSERNSLRVLAVLENPPKPNAKLLAAAKSLPKRR